MIILFALLFFFSVTFIISRLSRLSKIVLCIAGVLTIVTSYLYFGFIIESIFSDSPNPIIDNKMDDFKNLFKMIWVIAIFTISLNYIKNFFLLNIGDKTRISPPIDNLITINDRIRSLDISEKNSVVFFFQKRPPVKVISQNLVKIIYSITQDFGRNNFQAGELVNHFVYLQQHYHSSLQKDDYKRVLDICEIFVSEGGRVEIFAS